MENQSTIDKKKQQNRIRQKRRYDTNEEHRKNKNVKDNAYNKNKYHTDIDFKTKRQEYMRNKFKNDPEFRARSLANAKKWRESKNNAVIPEKNMKITDLDTFYLTCNIKQLREYKYKFFALLITQNHLK